MKKLFTTFCLAVVGLLTTTPIPAQFIVEFYEGEFGFTIIDEDKKSVALTQYMGSGRDVIIPSSVTYNDISYVVNQIGYIEPSGAAYLPFRYNTTITNVVIPETIEIISSSAFTNCTSLTYVKIPNSVIKIDFYAFEDCSSLSSLVLGDSLEIIEGRAFNGCSLTSLEIPSSITSIGYLAFAENKISTLTISGNGPSIEWGVFSGNPIATLNVDTKEIGESWFSNTETLTTLNLGNNVQSIGNSAFSGCSIASLEIPSSVTSIENSAFANNKLTVITLPKSLQSVGSGAFSGCPIQTINVNTDADLNGAFSYNELTKAVFADGATTIPSFSGASKLSDVTLPSPMTALPENAFTNCVSLKGITLPGGLQSIGNYAFSGCTGLTSIEIPSNVNSIGNNAFENTPFTSIVIPAGITTINNNTFANCEALASVELPSNLKSIGAQSFYGCQSLNQINLPNSLETIGSEVFTNCSLENIEFPASLTTIERFAFTNNNIGTLTLPKTLVSIGESAFYGNPIEKVFVNTKANVAGVFPYENLTEVIFAENAETIPSFQDATKLRDVTLPSLMETLPDNSFVDCISLLNVYFPEKLTGIGSNAFSGCSSLTELELPANLTSIGSGAFSNCSSIPVMKLPDGVTSISSNLFADCTGLEKVYFSENVKSFGANAFQNCSSLRSLIIPDGVETVPEGMMQNCTSLTEILIPNSVETVSQNAFQGCSSLRNIDLGTGVYTIGDYAFADCPNITDIHSMALNPPIAESYTFPTKAYTDATVTVREQSLATYNRENPWYRFQNYLTVSGAISLSHYNVDMAGNEVFQLGVYGSDSEIVWSSSNPAVAYANDCGLIVAMGITGATVITATVDGEEINCNVTVSSPYRDPQAYYSTRAGEDEEDLQPVDVIMEGVSGNPPMVNVRLVPVGSKTILDWTSSDPSLASVQNGLVTVHADGDVDFGVETENGLEETIEIDTQNIDKSGIEEIFQDTDAMMPMNVYDMTGRIIYFNATIEQIKNLKPGIYIIKGKKVLVK